MMILNPIRVTIENLASDYMVPIEKAIHSKIPSMGTNIVPFTSTVFIDQDDFRTEASPDFYRLSPGGNVGLLSVPFPISYVSHQVDSNGKVVSIVARYDTSDAAPKPKAYIQWVAEHAPSKSPVKVDETRIFKRLFKSDNPAALDDAYIQDIDPDSLITNTGALLETGIWQIIKESIAAGKKAAETRRVEALATGTTAPPLVDGVESIRFQGVRVAYFCLDYESKVGALEDNGKAESMDGDRLVLNQIAPLKEDAKKKNV